jgi:hypothetical protein
MNSKPTLNPKEITLNLLRELTRETCVFTRKRMCYFGDQLNEWPKEHTCSAWVKKPTWMDSYLAIADEEEQKQKHNDFKKASIT